MINEDYNYLFKTVLIGDTGVGKTSIAEKFVDNEFNNNFETTIGVDFKTKIVESNDLKFKIQIWDTAGQEKFRSITKTYYRCADAIIVIFDLSNPESFNLQGWIDQIKILNENATIFLVGNKSDLNKEVTKEKALELANNNNINYIECSAKTSQNINKLFDEIIDVLYKEGLKNNTLKKRRDIVEFKKKNFFDKGCCN